MTRLKLSTVKSIISVFLNLLNKGKGVYTLYYEVIRARTDTHPCVKNRCQPWLGRLLQNRMERRGELLIGQDNYELYNHLIGEQQNRLISDYWIQQHQKRLARVRRVVLIPWRWGKARQLNSNLVWNKNFKVSEKLFFFE